MAFLHGIETETGYSLLITDQARVGSEADNARAGTEALGGDSTGIFGSVSRPLSKNISAMSLRRRWEDIKENPKHYRSFILKSLAVLALVIFSLTTLLYLAAPADKAEQIENSRFGNSMLELIDYGNDLSGCDAGYYFIKSVDRTNKNLDANTYDTDRIYMSNYNSDNTRWRVCRRSSDNKVTLYSKSRKGFLDGGSTNIYVRASYDYEISDFARWWLVPVTNTNYIQIVNVGRTNQGSGYKYLDSNAEGTNYYPYVSNYPNSRWTYWTLVKAT